MKKNNTIYVLFYICHQPSFIQTQMQDLFKAKNDLSLSFVLHLQSNCRF